MKTSFEMNSLRRLKPRLFLLLVTALCPASRAQFADDFNAVQTDPAGVNGRHFRTGDGTATIDLVNTDVNLNIVGRCHGIAIKPLGAIHAGFYARGKASGKHSARLLFNEDGEDAMEEE